MSNTSEGEPGAFKLVESVGVDTGGLTPPTHLHRPSRSTVVAPQFLPQLRLPVLKHFSLACAAFLDKEAVASAPTQAPATCATEASPPRSIGISVFIILTDQCRRFPRPRLSSLPQGLPAEVSAMRLGLKAGTSRRPFYPPSFHIYL